MVLCLEISDIDHGKALFDWISSANGGRVSHKISIRRSSANGPFGVIAVEDIHKDEMILAIPHERYIEVSSEHVEDMSKGSDVESMKAYFSMVCQLALRLKQETEIYRTNPKQSKYEPFIRYLEETQPMGQLPATYSDRGKDILRQISGPGAKSTNYGNYSLPPAGLVDWIDVELIQNPDCALRDTPEDRHFAALSVQRGYDSELIPVWDMVNHNNYKLNLRTNSLRSPDGLKVWASKEIKAGEELYASYNFCFDCNDIGDEWGTPGIYRDFGFIESYPQEWPFLDQEVYFVVRYDKNGELIASFWSESDGVPLYVPTDEDMIFFQREQDRLEKMQLEDQLKKLPPHEARLISEYKTALIRALQCLSKEMKDNLRTTEKDEF